MQADTLREKFLDFFKSKKHKIVQSDSLAPKDDPTVLFTPAGMNQFKKEFLGFDSGFKRATTAQRCLRTDDLDKVGKTSGHHTFFEMLGNFSFGDYFKGEAITWAWEFLTKELKIKEDKLWVSIYKDDEEAYKIWRDKVGIPEEKIVRLGDKENFWPSQARENGPNGPCGPCSEIFFDLGKETGCKRADCNPACGCGRFVEVWNLVFTQFNRKEGGILEPLPQKNIDTGMGLERLAAVMQGAQNNFETDLFRPLVKEIANYELCAMNYALIYAVADHIRAIVFAIYDGVLPSNEARGYVVRKIIRKSILNLKALGIKQLFLYKLVPVLSEIMKRPYPDLSGRRENISQIILAEEKNFIATLESSEGLFKEKFKALLKRQEPQLAGKIAFQLYDTYGIPLELTKGWLTKQAIEISEDAFDKELKEQKSRSKLQSAMKGDVFAAKELHLGVKKTKFLGYKDIKVKAKILKIIKDGAEVKKIGKNEEARIILDQTVFYPESGGQLGDKGEIIKGRNIFDSIDTQKIGDVIVHIGKVREGSLKKADLALARIDSGRRLAIARNHTATHLLQSALRSVLGEHVKQQGSLVAEERLRFDFTHFKDIAQNELDRIEEIVNGYIMGNYGLEKKEMLLQQAKKAGALAFFGEKYESKVRVVSMGDFSKELCAGTHLDSTGQIGIFKIIQEGSIASGIRRIEATTGACAYKIIKQEGKALEDIASLLNAPRARIVQELERKLSRIKELEKELSAQRLNAIQNSLDSFIRQAYKINELNLIAQVLDNADMDSLRKAVDLLKQKTSSSVIALGSKQEARALLVIGLTADLAQKGLDASKLIVETAKLIGGSGGGRKDFAQAGGNSPENLGAALDELKKRLAAM